MAYLGKNSPFVGGSKNPATEAANLIVTTYSNSGYQADGKDPIQFLDVEIDQRDANAGGQRSPALWSVKDGKGNYENSLAYDAEAFKAMANLAKDNGKMHIEPVENSKGETVQRMTFGIKAPLATAFQSKERMGLKIDTRDMARIEPSEFSIDENTFSEQVAATKQAKEAAKAEKAAQKEEPAAQKSAEDKKFDSFFQPG